MPRSTPATTASSDNCADSRPERPGRLQDAPLSKEPSWSLQPAAMTTSTISPWPLIRQGNQHHPVETLQYLPRARGHVVTVDGIVGSVTWQALVSGMLSS